jgi:hypothetical protein
VVSVCTSGLEITKWEFLQWHVPWLAQQVYQLAGLTASAPKPITGIDFILKMDHVAWE